MITYLLLLGGILFLFMNLWFVISLIQKRNDVADEAWGLGFVLLAWSSFVLGSAQDMRGIVMGILVSIWGLRLAWHIHLRHRGHPEDYRYAVWRNTWGKWFLIRSYAQVYLLQGILLFIFGIDIVILNV